MITNDGAWSADLTAWALAMQRADLSPDTIRIRVYDVRRLARWAGGREPWTLTGDELCDYLRGHRWARETARGARSSLRAFWRWGVGTGRTGVDAAALAAANGIDDPRRLRPGQVLAIPRGDAAARSARVTASRGEPEPAPLDAPEPEPEPEPRRVTVASGDTLGAIARREGVDAGALAAANGIRNPRSLRPGQVLELPRAGGRTARAAAAPRTYTVRSGDTLYSIAQRHGVTSSAIAELNGLRDRHKLSIGQRLRLPAADGPG